MRTTISLPDDTHQFATYYANARGLTLSAAIDELIRKAKATPAEKPTVLRSSNGLPMFPPAGKVLTAEMVKKLSEDQFE